MLPLNLRLDNEKDVDGGAQEFPGFDRNGDGKISVKIFGVLSRTLNGQSRGYEELYKKEGKRCPLCMHVPIYTCPRGKNRIRELS